MIGEVSVMEQPRHEEIEERIERLAYAKEPDALYDFSEELLKSGYPREALLEDFKRLVLKLRAAGREDLEDDALDVLDALTGWCAPNSRL